MTTRTRTLIAGVTTLVLATGVSSMQHAPSRQASAALVPPLTSASEALAPRAASVGQDGVTAVMCEDAIARTTGAGTKQRPDAMHHMTVPSRAQGAGLVASGQMQHLMESMRSAMRQSARDDKGLTSCPCVEDGAGRLDDDQRARGNAN